MVMGKEVVDARPPAFAGACFARHDGNHGSMPLNETWRDLDPNILADTFQFARQRDQ
jgi:hypothetical protein